jgi:hypothetical protein
MSRAVVCDACGNLCQGNQYFSLQGWYGKGEHYPSRRRKEESWAIKQREAIAKLTGDLCPTCLDNHIGLTKLNPAKTRQGLIQELKAQNPELSGFELLRRTAGMTSISVKCDLCQKDCMEQHLRIKAGWLTKDNEELTSELCEPCVSHRLMDVIQFEFHLPETQASELSAV